MDQRDALAKLESQYNSLRAFLDGGRDGRLGPYRDPLEVHLFYDRWAPVRAALMSYYPTLLDDIPDRKPPESSGTTDHDGRGYILVRAIRDLFEDIKYTRDLLASRQALDAPTPSLAREGVFFAGQQFDALSLVSSLVQEASGEVVLVDGFVDGSVLRLLAAKQPEVHIRILTDRPSSDFEALADAFQAQHGELAVRTSRAFHDRFLLVDDDIYHLGASVKDAGRRGFMFSRVEEPDVVEAFRSKFEEAWNEAEVVR